MDTTVRARALGDQFEAEDALMAAISARNRAYWRTATAPMPAGGTAALVAILRGWCPAGMVLEHDEPIHVRGYGDHGWPSWSAYRADVPPKDRWHTDDALAVDVTYELAPEDRRAARAAYPDDTSGPMYDREQAWLAHSGHGPAAIRRATVEITGWLDVVTPADWERLLAALAA